MHSTQQQTNQKKDPKAIGDGVKEEVHYMKQTSVKQQPARPLASPPIKGINWLSNSLQSLARRLTNKILIQTLCFINTRVSKSTPFKITQPAITHVGIFGNILQRYWRVIQKLQRGNVHVFHIKNIVHYSSNSCQAQKCTLRTKV